MTPSRRQHHPQVAAAAWLLVCALATVALVLTTPAWGKILWLITAVAALRITVKCVRSAARDDFRRTGPQGVAAVRLRGEISAATVGETTRRLTDALASRPTALDTDMSKVEFLTSDGAMAFLAAARVAREQGTDVTVRNASPQARVTLHTLGLDRLQHYRDG